MSKVKKISFIILGLLVALMGGVITMSSTSNKGFAEGDGTYVEYKNQLSALDVRAYKYYTNDVLTPINSVSNGGFVLLENADTFDLSKAKQGVRFVIQSSNSEIYLPTLDVNVYLNGVQLSLGEAHVVEENVGAVSNHSLIFDIAPNVELTYYNQTNLDGTAKVVEDLQGVYVFDFKVMINKNGNTTNYYPQEVNWYRYSFTVLDQSNFGVNDVDDIQFPRILNVQPNPAYDGSPTEEYLRQNIFNFNENVNNHATYPALRYDPERYHIDIKRTFNNETTRINTAFVYTDSSFQQSNKISDYGILYFNYENGKSVGFKLIRQSSGNFEFLEDFDTTSSYAINYELPILYELGKYDITYKYQVFLNGEFIYEDDENQSVKIGTENLIVFGYTPLYANNLTDEAYFINLEENKETDLSYKYVVENVLSNFTIPQLDSFASTNQSPVWLKSYTYLSDSHIANSYYYYSKNGDDFKNSSNEMQLFANLTLEKNPYSKNTYFTDAGYYILALNYGFENFVGQNYSQIFMFRITNSTPVVKIVSKGNELGSGGFTNEDVVIQVEKPKVFDSSIIATYSVDSNFTNNFTAYKPFTPKFIGDDVSDYFTFTNQGKYYVRIYFNRTSYSQYSFTIDKLSLENQVSTYSVNPYNITSSLFSLNENLNKANVINKPFTLLVRNKPSNAPISVSLVTYDVVYKTNDMQTELYYTDSNKSYIYANYVAKNASSKQKYENIVATNSVSNIINSKYVFDKQKIYIFEITDAAGFRYVQSVFLDYTGANVLQYDLNDSFTEIEDFNIVSEKTTMKWGASKAILFDDAVSANDRSAMDLLIESSRMYERIASKLTLIIPYTSIVIESFDLAGESLDVRFNDYVKAEEFTIYPDLEKYSSVGETRVKGEKQYSVTINDQSGNKTVYRIEMNMDKSLGKMFTTNTPYISGDMTYRVNKLNLQQAGSLDALVFEWKDAEEGAYKIASLTYDYYPLVFDRTQANYPYSDTAENVMVDLLADASRNGELSYSSIINPMVTTTTGYDSNGLITTSTKIITKLGKYVIKRVYVGGYESTVEESGDTSTRIYIYYVDSNPIIDVPDFNDENAMQIGSGIQILFGQEEIPFTEFYREGLDTFTSISFEGTQYIVRDLNLILKSNLLPIKIKLPKTKYSIVNGASVESYNIPATFNLVAILSKYNENGYLEKQTEYKNVGANGYIAIDDIVKEGVYKLEIRDNALPYNMQLSPSMQNSDYIAFRVSFEQPSADIIVGKQMYAQSPTNPLILEINKELGKYVYNFDSSVVDTTTLRVYRREKIGGGAFSDYSEFAVNILSSTIELEPYETISNLLHTYQYKIVGNLRTDLSEFTQFTPVVADFDKFAQMGDYVTSTKENYVIFTFTDPEIDLYAKIDAEDIQVKKFTKLAKGNYSSPVLLVKDVDYVIEERILEDGRIQYSILIYAVDENNPLEELKYEINYHYLGDAKYYKVTGTNNQIVDYYSNSSTLIIDKTAPNYNLTRIQNMNINKAVLSENNLTSAYISTYYKAEDGIYYFANTGIVDLAIDKEFEFTRPETSATIYNPSHEGERIYFRKLNKYGKDENMSLYSAENQARAYQSLVMGNPEYYEGNSAKLRFNPVSIDDRLGFENWVEFGYNLGSFYNYLSALFRSYSNLVVDGYYEIVEIDEAGNHTVYTVLINTASPIVKAKVGTINGNVDEKYNSSTTEINSLNNFEILDITGLDAWYTITINQEKFVVNADSNMQDIIIELNKRFAINNVNVMRITNRFGDDLTFNVNISTADKKIGIASVSDEINGFYKVLLESDDDGVMLKKVSVYVFDEGISEFVLCDNNGDGICEDSENTKIIVDVTKAGSRRDYNFVAGIYKFVFEDNFRSGDSAYEVNINIGVYGNYTLEYEKEPVYYNNMLYTSGTVTLTAPRELFNVTATKNGNIITLNEGTHIFRPEPISYDVDMVSGGETTYMISIYNITTGDTETHQFTIYNIFPAINAIDSQDESMNSILSLNRNQVSTFTTKSIRLNWSLAGYKFGYGVKLIRYEDGGVTPTNEIDITASSVSVSNQGLYELKFTTMLLGSSRSVFFMIKDSTISMYEVYERLTDGSLSVVKPAEELLDITDYNEYILRYLNGEHGQTYPLTNDKLLVKNYFSIYNFQIEVEGDKNLKTNFGDLENEIIYIYEDDDVELAGKFNTNIVVVYGVSPYSYLDIFAVTKILPNSKFLENFGYSYDIETEKEVTDDEGTRIVKQVETKEVNLDARLYDNVAVYDAPLTINFQSYYGVKQNRIYVKYYFNGRYIDTIYGNSEDGEISSFSINTAGEYRCEFYDLAGNRQLFASSNTPYFTIILKNEVVYTVNGDLPIYGAVYNNDVVLRIQDISSYVTRSLSVSVFKNGQSFKVNAVNYEYTFTEQGLYRVLITGSVREGNAVKKLKTSEVVFSIINKNEARFAYEFSNINGYEISKVVKNNIDITNNIKGDNVAIYSLLISDTSYGVGKYHIYVKGNRLNSLNAGMEFDFYIWINNEIPAIQASINYNETTTDNIVLTYNTKAIYEQIGNCRIVIGNEEFAINDKTVDDKISTITIQRAGTYFVKLETEAGNVVSMFKVVKKDPLNAFSIILIILGSLALIGGAVVFYRLRIRMRVK